MGCLRQIGEIKQIAPVFIESVPTAASREPIFRKGSHRAGLDALAAFFTGFDQAGMP
jgi:hypothetical protein